MTEYVPDESQVITERPPFDAKFLCITCDANANPSDSEWKPFTYTGDELKPLVIDADVPIIGGREDWLDPRCPKGHCCLMAYDEAAQEWQDKVNKQAFP